MEHGQHHESGYHDSNGQWIDSHHGYHAHSHHASPVQEYNGFAFGPLPVEPMYSSGMHQPRTTHQQLQPLTMPQWPSMLTSQSTYVPPIYPSAPVPAPSSSTPVSVTPVSATSSRGGSSTPRKTLTDSDRRRMCLYHEEHPTTKQAEIGAMFGVERSTVSKVLRQKEKYLYQEDGSRSPIKRAKGKFPDIERALSNWARNHQRQGLNLTDAMIREKARFFAATVGSSDSHVKVNSTSWLEKFKQKNGLMGAKSRKNSLAAEDAEPHSATASNSHTPHDISPVSPSGMGSPSPIQLSAVKSEENLKSKRSDSYVDFNHPHQPFHSQSNTSLSSVFTDTAPSSFSAGPTSPTSPFFTPDSACGPSPFLPQHSHSSSGASAVAPPGSSNFQRPRSQTFPLLQGIDPYISPASSEPLTPKYLPATTLESPATDSQAPAIGGGNDTMQPPPLPTSGTPSGTPSITVSTQLPHMKQPLRPSPQQQHALPVQQLQTPISPDDASSPLSPSSEDARRALELVMHFFQHQPSGFVDPQEYVTIGKLMEKLRLQQTRSPSIEHQQQQQRHHQRRQSSGSGEHHPGSRLPGGLHRIPERAGV